MTFFKLSIPEIASFQAQGNVLVTGDLNGRTGIEPDVIDLQGSSHVFDQSLSSPHQPSPIRTALNLKKQTKKQSGRAVVHLCWTVGLYIVDGS